MNRLSVKRVRAGECSYVKVAVLHSGKRANVYVCSTCGTAYVVGDLRVSTSATDIVCKFCRNETPKALAHWHDGGWVGECCWDDRLKVTE